jgi:light-regulated signal transduction histidine kinase (bacteriophytochrome)
VHSVGDDPAARLAALEAQLRERDEQLARCQAELLDFASVVAHDLRSPLVTISGYCDLLRHEFRGRLDGATEHYLTAIIDGVSRMNRLIEDLLRYAKLRTTDGSSEQVDLGRVLSDVASDLAGSIRDAGARIEVSSLPCVRGNYTRLVQLFQNVIDNAVKFRGPEPPLIRVSATSDAGGWLIRVEDNGMGIDPGDQEAVFRPLHRLPRGRHLPGTGIGLAICKRIVEGHAGRIWIESDGQHGSTFVVWLPAAETADQGDRHSCLS